MLNNLTSDAILDGRQPRDLTAEKLLEHSRLPLAWHDHSVGRYSSTAPPVMWAA